MYDALIASLAVFCGELYGNLVGGGSLVTQFFLQDVLEIPIKNAIALDNAAVVGSELGLLYGLRKHHSLKASHFFFLLFVVLGALFGSYSLYLFSEQFMGKFFVCVVVAVTVKILASKKGSLSEGLELYDFGDRYFSLILFGLFLGWYNAVMAVGDFIIGLVLIVNIFHFRYSAALFVLSFVLAFGRLSAGVMYYQYDLLDLSLLVPMFLSATLSGLIIGRVAHRIPTERINILLKAVAVCLSASLVHEHLLGS